MTAGRRRDGRRGVWQPKFWEHTIEDEEDFERHFDYIHYHPVKHGPVKHGPVKHGYVTCPADWPWSSFHRWVREGVDAATWGCGDRHPGLSFADIEHTVGESQIVRPVLTGPT